MNKIPKIIHYCWFGNNPLPDDYKKNIESWKKYMPDYEIKLWSEKNVDLEECAFIKETYDDSGRWIITSGFICFKSKNGNDRSLFLDNQSYKQKNRKLNSRYHFSPFLLELEARGDLQGHL